MDAEPRDASAAAAAEPAHAERLLDLQLAFNLYPAWYAHPSWLATLGDASLLAEEYCELRTSPQWLRAMSTALLCAGQLQHHFDCDFFDPAKRLALIDAVTLTRIGGLVSATLMRERLRRVVLQSEMRAVHACMGAEAHEFAVRWSGLLPMVGPAIESGAWPMRATWERNSIAQLFSALPSHAIGVIGRLRMKFPCDWPASRQRLVEPQRVGLTKLIVGVLLQSGTPWNWLFAPDFTAAHATEARNGAQPC
jgi:hypothetical protein